MDCMGSWRISNYLPYLLFFSIILSVCSANIQINPASGLSVRTTETAIFTAVFDEAPSDVSQIGWSINGILLVKTDTPLPKYEVKYDSASKTSTLKVKDITIGDDGFYLCQLTSGPNGSKASNRVKLTVLVPPVQLVVQAGATQDVQESKDYNITCVAKGSNPAVTISWLKNGAAATETAVQSAVETDNVFTTTGVLTVKASQADGGSQYTCKATGEMMMTPEGLSASTSLNVQYAPKLTLTPGGDVSFTEQTSATFTCTSDANPTDIMWKWFLNDEELSGDGPSYTFSPISAEHNGKTLKCQATNSIGTGEVAQKLNVEYAPRLTEKAANVEVDIGDTVTLKCQVDGNPSPTIIWMREGGSSRILSSLPEFKISQVREEDIGAYRCIGSVNNFENAIHTVHVLKKDVPKISGSKDFSFSQGSTATITCEAKCIPFPTEIVWRKGHNGERVDLSSSSRFSVTNEDMIDGIKSHLYIKDVASNDFDEYNCTVVNSRGADTVIFTLTQIDDFPWVIVLAVGVSVIVLAIVVTIAVCCCRRNRDKTSSAGSSSDPYWLDGKQFASESSYLQFYPTMRSSLSMASHTTDNSTKKPADGIERIESPSLPEYSLRSVDAWRTHDADPVTEGYDVTDYPKPELYGTFRANPVNTSYNAYPTGNYGTYRVNQSRESPLPAYTPQYSTLPLRPAMLPPEEYNRFGYGVADDFPEPPLEARLATNV